MEVPKKRKDLSLAEKMALLKRYDSLPEMSQRNAALRLDISQPLLCKILKTRDDLETRVRDGKHPNLEARNNEGDQFESAQRNFYTNPDLLNGSVMRQMLADDLSVKKHSFAIDDGWSGSYKVQTAVDPKNVIDLDEGDIVAMGKWLKEEWPKILTKYTLERIYKADETVIYYRALPNYKYLFRNELMDNNEVAKKRLSVICCVSMSGSKKKLMAIGKNDVSIQSGGVVSLPIDYVPVPNPTMTAVIFNEWLAKWDRELKQDVLVLVEKSPIHVISQKFKRIKVVSLSSSIIALIQPLNQVIIKELKSHFRESLKLRSSGKEQQGAMSELSDKLDLLEILHLLGLAWDRVSADTILKSFSLSRVVGVDKKPLQLVMQRDGLVSTGDLPLDMSARKTPTLTVSVVQRNEGRKESPVSKHEARMAIGRVSHAAGDVARAGNSRMAHSGTDSSPDTSSSKMMLLKRKHEQVTPPAAHTNDSSKTSEKTSTSLVPPIRQTASIFKQSVTIVKPQKSTVRADITFGVQEKPKQLFWEKRLQGLTACDDNGQIIECFELPKKVRAVGLQLSDDTILRSIATALHLNSHPITGQNKPKPLLDKNPGVYINPGQPLVLGVHVTDEDIAEQEKKVENARKLLQEALQEAE